MLNRLVKTFFVLAYTTQSTFGLAQAQKDLSDMNLEEILNMEVVTASKKKETLAEAPAIVSVILVEDLRSWGVNSLAEALAYLPGVTVTESYLGYTTVNFRGVRQLHYNNKILFLINGHPSFEKVNGSFHLEQIPFETVERIEVVRGPGSALYGTNAFTGVINVITKKGQKIDGADASIQAGGYGKTDAGFVMGRETQQGQWNLAGHFRDDGGYPYKGTLDEPSGGARVPVSIDYKDEVASFLGEWHYKNITVNSGWFEHKKSKLGITPEVNWSGPSKVSGYFADMTYKHESAFGEILLRLRYDRNDRELWIGHFPADAAVGRDSDTVMESGSSLYGGELQISRNLGNRFSLVSGIVYEQATTDPYFFIFTSDRSISPFSAYQEEYENRDASIFAQVNYKSEGPLSAIAGLRYNRNSDATDDELVPRLGLVYKANPKTYIKALYGQAYRNPDFFEKYVATNGVLFGDPNLEREEIATFDLGLDYAPTEHISLRVSGFWLETDNLISRRAAIFHASGAEYYNTVGERIGGVELELKTRYAQKSFFLNLGYKDGEDRMTAESLTGIADWTINGGLSYRWNSGLVFDASLRHVGAKEFRSVLDGNGETAAYNLVNVGIRGKLGPMGYSIRTKNLLDETYMYPEYIRANVAELPGGPGREVFGEIRYRFK